MIWKLIQIIAIWYLVKYFIKKFLLSKKRPTRNYSSNSDFANRQELEMQFLRYMFSMMAKLAKSDGRINESEVRTAEKVFSTFSFAAKRRSFCSRVFNEAKDNSRSIYWYADQFASIVSDRSTRLFMYDILWDVACADGDLHPEEKRILQTLCTYLRIPESCFIANYMSRFTSFSESDGSDDGPYGQYERARSRTYSSEGSISDAYALLGCRESDSDKVVKAAYRAAALKYHPDRLRQNGVPEEMIAKATTKMAEVNSAWDRIRKSRGI